MRAATGQGELFLDGYDGYDEASSLTARFSFGAGVLRSRVAGGARRPVAAGSWVERVCFWGQTASRSVVVRASSGDVVPGATSAYDSARGTLTVRQPNVRIGDEWSIELS